MKSIQMRKKKYTNKKYPNERKGTNKEYSSEKKVHKPKKGIPIKSI